MTTKVKPTVEKWERDYSKIMLEWIESQWKIEAAHQAGEPYTRMKFEADAHKIEQKLLTFIRTLLSHSVQEAKAEERKRILEAIQPAVNDFMAAANTLVEHKMVKTAKEMRENTQYIVCAIRGTHKEYAASLKQEESR